MKKDKLSNIYTKFTGTYITQENYNKLQKIALQKSLDMSKLLRIIIKEYLQKIDNNVTNNNINNN